MFPKPKTNLDKCMRWIKACGRPHEQLNVDRINKHKAVCSKHFVGGNGPTTMYPDPIQADGSRHRSRIREKNSLLNNRKRKLRLEDSTKIINVEPVDSTEEATAFRDQTTQTDIQWVSPVDVLSLSVEIHQLRSTVESQERTIADLKKLRSTVESQERTIVELQMQQLQSTPFPIKEEVTIKEET